MLIVGKRAEISTWGMLFPDLFKSIVVGVRLNSSGDFSMHESTEVFVDLVVVELLLGQLRRLLEIVGLVVREADGTGLNTQIEPRWIGPSRRVLDRGQGRQRRLVLILVHKALGRPRAMLRQRLELLWQRAFAGTSNIRDPLFPLSLQLLHHVIVSHFPISAFDYLHLLTSI